VPSRANSRRAASASAATSCTPSITGGGGGGGGNLPPSENGGSGGKKKGEHTGAKRGMGEVTRVPGGFGTERPAAGSAPRTTLPGVHRAARADARPDRAGAQGVLVRGRRGGRSGAGERDDSPDARRPQRTFADGNVL